MGVSRRCDSITNLIRNRRIHSEIARCFATKVTKANKTRLANNCGNASPLAKKSSGKKPLDTIFKNIAHNLSHLMVFEHKNLH